jgi:hypothetical protein
MLFSDSTQHPLAVKAIDSADLHAIIIIAPVTM